MLFCCCSVLYGGVYAPLPPLYYMYLIFLGIIFGECFFVQFCMVLYTPHPTPSPPQPPNPSFHPPTRTQHNPLKITGTFWNCAFLAMVVWACVCVACLCEEFGDGSLCFRSVCVVFAWGVCCGVGESVGGGGAASLFSNITSFEKKSRHFTHSLTHTNTHTHTHTHTVGHTIIKS